MPNSETEKLEELKLLKKKFLKLYNYENLLHRIHAELYLMVLNKSIR